jgi:hypothetical protein
MGDFLKGPLTATIEAIGGVLGKFIASPEDKLKAQLELTKIEMELREKILQADVEMAKAGASVITAEATSGNWLASSWRPVLMYVFTYVVFHNYVVAPVFHAASVPIPPDLWDLLRIGIGGYIGGRSLEKIVPQVAEILKK